MVKPFSSRPRWPKFNKNQYEKDAWQQDMLVMGIDEVGRGCLAGPVVTAAVVLPPGKVHRLLKDSKILSEQERLTAYKWIIKHCHYSVGVIHHRLIDRHNIWHATLKAMKKSSLQLLCQIEPSRIACIVIDAMPLALKDTCYLEVPIHHFPFGEQKSSSIAAASIVAKVTRDRMMTQLSDIFPGFLLAQHKGYSTPAHKKRIGEAGHSIIHRISYLNRTVYCVSEKKDTHTNGNRTIQQQSLC